MDFPGRVCYNCAILRRMQPGRSVRPMKDRGGTGRRARRIRWRRFLPMLLLLAVFLYAAVNLLQYAIRSAATKRTNEALQEMHAVEAATEAIVPEVTPEAKLLDSYQYIGAEILPEMAELYAKNPDLVAWLHIPGVVNLPVVYRDNAYYLDYDFNGAQSDSGTLFLDEAHPFAADTQYLVVHGHNMYDGSMFARLSHYRRRAYMEEHPTVDLTTLYRQERYGVIGALDVPESFKSDGYVAYTGTRRFASLDRFEGFVRSLRENALYWKEGAELLPGDALLALSTCYRDDRRIVVICRRIAS